MPNKGGTRRNKTKHGRTGGTRQNKGGTVPPSLCPRPVSSRFQMAATGRTPPRFCLVAAKLRQQVAAATSEIAASNKAIKRHRHHSKTSLACFQLPTHNTEDVRCKAQNQERHVCEDIITAES
eukprot:scaffold7954_cov70-Cyclotella_meneghiniana.AAC.2